MNQHCCGCNERAGVECAAGTEVHWCRDCWTHIGTRWLKQGHIDDLQVWMIRGGYGGDDE
jgi:hypothetical protein